MVKASEKDFLILITGFSIIMFSFCGVQQYIGLYISKEVGLASLVILYSAFGLSSLLVAPRIVAWLGYKRCLLFSPVLFALYLVSLATGHKELIFIAAAFIGIASGPLWTAGYLCLSQTGGKNGTGKKSGLFYTAYGIGAFAGILLLGLLSSKENFSFLFLLFGAFISIAIILFCFLKPPVVTIRKKEKSATNILQLAFNPYILRASLIAFIAYAIFGLIVAQVPSLLKDLGLQGLTLMTSIFFLFPAILSKKIGQFTDRAGRIKLIKLAYIISLIGILLLLFVHHPAVIIAGLILLTISFTILQPCFTTVQIDISPQGLEESIAGFFLFMRNLGMVLVIVLFLIFALSISLIIVCSLILLCFLSIHNFPETKDTIQREKIKNQISILLNRKANF